MTIFKILVITLLVFPLSSLFSQENVLKPKSPARTAEITPSEVSIYKIGFGLELGLNYNMASQTLTWQPEIPQSIYNVFKSASGISPYFAALVDFPIDNKFGIQAKVAYDMRSYSNTYTGIADYYDFNNSIAVDGNEAQKIEVTGADISISAMLRYNISNDLVMSVGPMFSIPAGDYSQDLTQTSLSDGRNFYDEFGNPFKERVVSSKITNIKTRIGIDLGFGYNIPISSSMVLTPQIRMNYYFSKINDDEIVVDDTRAQDFGNSFLSATDAKLQALKFGVCLWF
jgi:hypothetical protein